MEGQSRRLSYTARVRSIRLGAAFNRKNFVMQITIAKIITIKYPLGRISSTSHVCPNLGPVVAELLEKRASGIYNAAGEQNLKV